jgi:hypothetical protein
VQGWLGGANSQLKYKNQERDERLDRAQELRELWKRSQVEGNKLKEGLKDAKQQLNIMVNEYEGYVLSEKLQKEAVERAHASSQLELKKE